MSTVPPTEPVPATPEPATPGPATAAPGPHSSVGAAATGTGPGFPPARRRGPLVAALVVAVVLLVGSVGATVAWATVGAAGDRGVLRPWDGMPGMHRGWDRGGQPGQGVQPGPRSGQGGGWRGTGPGVGPGFGPGSGRAFGPGFGPGMHRGYGPAPVPSPSASS